MLQCCEHVLKVNYCSFVVNPSPDVKTKCGVQTINTSCRIVQVYICRVESVTSYAELSTNCTFEMRYIAEFAVQWCVFICNVLKNAFLKQLLRIIELRMSLCKHVVNVIVGVLEASIG